MSSLRTLLVRGPMLVLGVVLAVLVLTAGIGLQRIAWKDAEARVEENLDHVSKQIDFRLEEMERLAESIGQAWEAGRIDPTNPAACWGTLAPWVRPHAHLTGVNLVRADGGGFGMGKAGDRWGGRRLYHEDGAWRFGPVLGDAAEADPALRSPGGPGFDFRERPWYQLGLRIQRATWTEVVLFAGRRAGRPGIFLVRPVRDLRGQLLGVLSLDLQLGSLSQVVWEVRPTPGSWLMVLDGKGRVVVPPSVPNAGPEDLEKSFLRTVGPDLFPVAHELFQGLRAGSPEGRRFHTSKDRFHGRLRSLGRPAGPDWHLVLALPDQDISSDPRRRALLIGGIGLLVMTLFGFLAHHFTRRVARPLTRLAEGAEALARGDQPVLAASRIQEIQTLSDALATAHAGIAEREALHARLRQSQRMEAVGTLAGGVAHDLNNQLTAILTHLELGLEKLDRDHPSWTNLKRAWDATRRCADTTKAILSFSRPSKPELAPLDLNLLVEGTLALLAKLMGPGIKVEKDLQAAPATVQGDRSQLEQLLVNLLLNARDALPAGGTIQVWTEVEGDLVALRVQDNGTGMAPEVLERIFEPFFTTKGLGQGTGLGLATAQGVARAHHGTLEAESEWGKGSCFILQLPQVRSAVARRDTGEIQPHPSLKGIDLLVVDDEEALRSGMAEVLESCHARVRMAADGEAAWALWLERPADFVLTDQLMPRCTGTELLERLRAGGSRVPVLLLSGRGLEGHEENLAKDPLVAHLPKPFTIARLLAAIGQLLQRAKAG